MKNLKQVLALGMAFSLSLSTMASAAFTDQKDIKATEAVDMLSALGVVQGYEDGSFKPEGTVTRAEAAKMIFTIRNGGNANADSFKSVASSFTDIKGHWAEGYIKYCQSMGIIAGKSATTFDPNGTVTGVELAKMMLVTLGYDAQTAGLVGSTWSQKTLSLAGENGLLDDVNTDLAAGCPRQYAAQLMYNAILAPTVVLRENVYSNKNLLGEDNDTVGKKYMGLIETVVTLNGDSKSISTLSSGETQVAVASDDRGSEITTAGDKTITYTVDKIESKIGENFKLLWKDTNNDKNLDKNDKVYGMYSSNTTTVLNITANDIDDADSTTKIKLDGTKYDVATSGTISYNYGGTNTSKDTSWATDTAGVTALKKLMANTGDKVRVILDDSNKVSKVYVVASELYKVTAVNGDSISIAGVGTIDKTKNDNVVYDGIAKDDVVAVTKLYDTNIDDATVIVEKAETVSGKLTGFTNAGGSSSNKDYNKNLVVDGTTYKVYGEGDSLMKTGLTDDSMDKVTSDEIDTNVTLYLVNGYVYAVQKSTEEANKYAIVTDVDDSGKLGSTFNAPKVELLLADGTKKTVTLNKDSKLYTSGSEYEQGDHAGSGSDPIKDNGTVLISSALHKGDLVKYVEMSNGEFKVEEIGVYAKTADDKTTELYDKDTKQFNNVVTSGECPLFYTDGTEYKVTTIRSLNDIDVEKKAVEYAAYTKDGKVVAAFINLGDKPSGVSEATMYGIVTSDPMTTNKDGDTYTMYTVATNDNNETKLYISDTTKIKKGDLVYFDKSADDTYKDANITVCNADDTKHGVAVAVTDYNESDKTITYVQKLDKVDANNFKARDEDKITKAVDSDVKIAYVNTDDDKAGAADYGVNEFDSTKGFANAMLIFDGNDASKKVIGIIVNTDPDTNILGTKTTLPTVQDIATEQGKVDNAVKDLADETITTSDLSTATTSTLTLTDTSDYTFSVALASDDAGKASKVEINSNKVKLTPKSGTFTHDDTVKVVVTATSKANTSVKATKTVTITIKDQTQADKEAANKKIQAAKDAILALDSGVAGETTTPVKVSASGSNTSAGSEKFTYALPEVTGGVSYEIAYESTVSGNALGSVSSATVAKNGDNKTIDITEDSNSFGSSAKVGVKVTIKCGTGDDAVVYLLVTIPAEV